MLRSEDKNAISVQNYLQKKNNYKHKYLIKIEMIITQSKA
ncbi:hypothetical protein BN135_3223 [Cronobacter muytjensii 530]